MLKFSQLIKTERKKARLTQRELVELAGSPCTVGYLSNIERNAYVGKKGHPARPDIEIVDAFAKALKIPQKTARDAANYASPDVAVGDSPIAQVFSLLFSGYERLDASHREMALFLCGGILNNLYEMQMRSKGVDLSLDERQPSGAAAGKRLHVIYPATDTESVPIEIVTRQD